MRVAELEGATLDYWVHRALLLGDRFEAAEGAMPVPQYSIDWILAEPIFEHEQIFFEDGVDGSACKAWKANTKIHHTGKTSLIASMRCFVASKFGEEVEDAPQNAS